jgi:hypothetical protein
MEHARTLSPKVIERGESENHPPPPIICIYVVYMNACYLLVIKLNYKKSIFKFGVFCAWHRAFCKYNKRHRNASFCFYIYINSFYFTKIYSRKHSNDNLDDDIHFLLFSLLISQRAKKVPDVRQQFIQKVSATEYAGEQGWVWQDGFGLLIITREMQAQPMAVGCKYEISYATGKFYYVSSV